MTGRTILFISFLLNLIFVFNSNAQITSVKGKVIDAKTGDPVPFANIVFKGTNIGATTNFVGLYEITTRNPTDSLVATYIGYKSRTKSVKIGETQEINFQLEEDVKTLEEVVFVAEENPAWSILRNVVRNKDKNDKRSLIGYEFESYNKIEIDLDNLTEKFRSRKIVKKVKQVIDSIDQIAGEDGEPVLPIFISESLSKFYWRDNPKLQKEHILKTKITGVGVQDGTLISQFIGSTFQEYNFYQNWLNIWDKEFVSPIADGWKAYYEVYLMDSLFINDHFTYRIDVFPKREGDLAFNGTIWIDKDTWALKQVDLWVDEATNLNFVEKIKIQQELEPTAAGPWVPVKSRITTDFQLMQEFGFNKQGAGILAKFYTSNKNWKVNNPYEPKFYDQSIVVEEDATTLDPKFWDENRHDPLSSTEKNVISMIDTLKKIKPVKRLSDIITYVASGYITIGKFDIGPYPLFYAYNNVEGHRIRFGGQTNIGLSKKVVLKGYGAYGTDDEEFKYGAGADFILKRKPWTEIGIYRRRDIQQVGLTFDDVYSNVNLFTFEAYFRNVDHVTPYFLTENRLSFRRTIKKGINQKIIFRHRKYKPIELDSSFNFAFRVDPSLGDLSPLRQDFNVAELTLETRFGKDELWVINDNDRFSLGPIKAPVFTLRYTLGVEDVLGGDFNYHKVTGNVFKRFKMGLFGVSSVSVTGGRIFGQVPMLLLKGHLGNESPFFISIAYNTMGFSEFVSDTWAEFNYKHQFEGFLLNRIPLFKKLKWRTVATANVLYGDVRSENKLIHSETGLNGLPNLEINELDGEPYVEVGYGIENIFKVFRIDAFHRLTHLDNSQGNKFAFKFSFELTF